MDVGHLALDAAQRGARRRPLFGLARGARLVALAPLALAATLCLVRPAVADADLSSQLIAKFDEGMRYFREDDFVRAAALWRPIVVAVGDERAYRILFNLAVACERMGDATDAASSLERFLRQVDARRAGGKAVAGDVLDFEREARARLVALQNAYARVALLPEPDAAYSARVDGGDLVPAGVVLYVAPGSHEVTLRAGTDAEEKRSVSPQRGERVELRPTPRAAPRQAPPTRVFVRVPVEVSVRRPFSAWWVAASGGLALATAAIPIALYEHARSIGDRFRDPATPHAERESLDHDYDAANTRYKASYAIPLTFGVATGVLAGAYLVGGTRESTLVGVLPAAGGASFVVAGPLGF